MRNGSQDVYELDWRGSHGRAWPLCSLIIHLVPSPLSLSPLPSLTSGSVCLFLISAHQTS